MVSKLKVSFEIEFCHHFATKTVKTHIRKLMPHYVVWISRSFRKQTKEVNAYTLYQDNTVDPDYGDQNVYELVTPLWDYDDALKHLQRIFTWIKETGGTTNHTTALHVNMSWSGKKFFKKINPWGILAEINEEIILKRFKRVTNKHCRPHWEYLQKRKKRMGTTGTKMDTDRPVYIPSPYIYRSFYVRPAREGYYVEFRMIGNKDYHLRFDAIETTLLEYAAAMKRAINFN